MDSIKGAKFDILSDMENQFVLHGDGPTSFQQSFRTDGTSSLRPHFLLSGPDEI